MNKKFNINGNEYIFDGNNLELYLKDDEYSNDVDDTPKSNAKIDEGLLYKLVFSVSNTCNLNCKYCYANGGNYKREDNIMTQEDADAILKKVFKKYNKLQTIYFFGGEPLLNFKVIEYIVNKINEHYPNKKFDYRVVTNGIFLDSKIINFFDKNNFKVYVSIDGPKNIHEHLRGINTFDKIMDNLELLKKAKNIKVELSCTYTKYHQDNIAFEDLIEFFDSLGFKYSINDVDTNDKELKLVENKSFLEREKEFIDSSINKIISNSKSCRISYYLTAVIDALITHQKHENYCKELANNYSNVFDYNGEEYNCIRLLGFLKKDAPIILEKNQKSSEICKNCWCKNICRLCLAEILLGTNTFPFENDKCKVMELYEYALEKIIYLLDTNEEDLKRLLNNYLENFTK